MLSVDKEETSFLSHPHIRPPYVTWRYEVIRFLSYPVAWIPCYLPIIGGKTYVELVYIFLLSVLGLLIAVLDGTKDAGNVADIFGCAAVVFGMRSNLLNAVLGISYERALFWHKLVSYIALVITVYHAFCGMNFSGLMLIVCFGVMTLTYWIKTCQFESFYYVHLLNLVIIIPFSAIHGAPVLTVAASIWLLEVILRESVTTKVVSAEVTSLPGDVIRVSIADLSDIAHTAGQYVFIRIKAVNATEYHPFSFSSSPTQGITTIHIRELGDWTKRLGSLTRSHYANTPDIPLTMDIMLDGPYGNHTMDLESKEYDVFLLISGGIGITPIQSVYNHLISQVAQEGRPMKKVLFIWSVRDRVLIEAMTPDMLESNKKAIQGAPNSLLPSSPVEVTPLSFQPPMNPLAPDLCNDMTVTRSETETDDDGDHDDASSAKKSKIIEDIYDNQIFHNQFYLTKSRDKSGFEEAGIDPEHQPWLHFGRPDLPTLFEETAQMCASSMGSALKLPRVAVLVCGPQGMVNTVKDLCRTTRVAKGDVAFDCHAEVFDF